MTDVPFGGMRTEQKQTKRTTERTTGGREDGTNDEEREGRDGTTDWRGERRTERMTGGEGENGTNDRWGGHNELQRGRKTQTIGREGGGDRTNERPVEGRRTKQTVRSFLGALPILLAGPSAVSTSRTFRNLSRKKGTNDDGRWNAILLSSVLLRHI